MSRIEKLMKMLEVDGSDAFVLYGIAQEHARAGRHAEAVAFYDRCIAADGAYCYAYYHKAVSQQAGGDVDGARTTLTAGMRAAEKAGEGKALGEMQGLMEGIGEC